MGIGTSTLADGRSLIPGAAWSRTRFADRPACFCRLASSNDLEPGHSHQNWAIKERRVIATLQRSH
jgi:hypothetical protein